MINIDKNTLYFIKAGSSYALDYSVTNYVQNKKIQRIDLDWSSVGIHYIKYSILETVNFLLKKGVNESDIYVVSDLSQIGRFYTTDVNEFAEEYYLKNKLIQNINIDNEFYFNFLSNGIIDVNGNIFDCMIRGSFDSYSSKLKNILTNNQKLSYTQDSLFYIEDYLENLVELQKELSNKNINYSLYPMNNIFEGWFIEDDIIKHKYSYHIEYSLPNLSDCLLISELSEKSKELFSQVDLDNICFYKGEGNEFGGMDEFAIDNYTEDVFTDTPDKLKNQNFFGYHPRQFVRNDYFNKYIKERYDLFLEKSLL